MAKSVDKIAQEIRELPDAEKLRLVDAILTDLDKPDPEIDRIWADEARQRWAPDTEGRIPTVSYEEVMAESGIRVRPSILRFPFLEELHERSRLRHKLRE